MEKIGRSFSFWIDTLVYPLIKSLYNLAIDIGSTEFFTQGEIRNLTSNLYLLVSVCILFALGVKLLSAIVNPDVLTREKNGVKSTFLHVLLALLLISLTPVLFNSLYILQSYIVKNQIIEKIVLGGVDSSKDDAGQIIAAYTFMAFCEPSGETTSSLELSSDEDAGGGNAYNETLEDISKIDEIKDSINSKTDGEFDLDYNGVLSPVVGIFMAYQMVLLCIDLALRAFKLLLLQLITPIILCAYILTGNDSLQKWAKMVLSTYLLLFIKIALLSFMAYALSYIPDIFSKMSEVAKDKSAIYKGLVYVFMMIGLLMLVKQIPEILNNILGLDIKSDGGIKGRLGEMAGVRNLAQNAWDTTKKFGVAGAVAGAALSSVGAAVGAGGIAAAAGLAHHGWTKRFGSHRPLKDTKGGRILRRTGGVAKGIWTGAKDKSVNPLHAINTGREAYKNSDGGQLAAAGYKTKIASNVASRFTINPEDGTISKDTINKLNSGNTKANDLVNNAVANSKYMNANQQQVVAAYAKATGRSEAVKKVSENSDKIAQQFTNMSQNYRNMASTTTSEYDKARYSAIADDFANKVNAIKSDRNYDYTNAAKDAKNIFSRNGLDSTNNESVKNNMEVLSGLQTNFDNSVYNAKETFGLDSNISTKAGLDIASRSASGLEANAKAAYDAAIQNAGEGSRSAEEMQSTLNAANTIYGYVPRRNNTNSTPGSSNSNPGSLNNNP